MHRAGRIKRSSITEWELEAPIIRPCQLGCGILFRALDVLSTAKNFHKTAICHLRRPSSLLWKRRGMIEEWDGKDRKEERKRGSIVVVTRVYDRLKNLSISDRAFNWSLARALTSFPKAFFAIRMLRAFHFLPFVSLMEEFFVCSSD